VLELKRDKKGEARDLFSSAQASSDNYFIAGLSMTRLLMLQEYAPHNYEPFYNIALLANKAGQYQVSSSRWAFASLVIICRFSLCWLLVRSRSAMWKKRWHYTLSTLSQTRCWMLSRKNWQDDRSKRDAPAD
jgi:hypothetical protein